VLPSREIKPDYRRRVDQFVDILGAPDSMAVQAGMMVMLPAPNSIFPASWDAEPKA
jgi:hypothetical protein